MTHYFRNTLLKLTNNYLIEDDPFVPSSWKIDFDTSETFKSLIKSDVPFYDNYRPINKSQNSIMIHMLNTITNIITDLEKIVGNSEIYSCKNEIIETKVFTHKMISILLKYLFLVMLDKLLDIDIDNMELDEQEYNFQVNEYEQEELDISTSLEKSNQIQTKLIYDILLKIEKDRQYLNKHTKTYINKVIETKIESDKEANLRFIQDLDKETWNSLKNMISLGLDTWKNLSNKNRDLYIPPKEPSGEDEIENTYDEQQGVLEQQAQQDLGNNYSDTEYQQWLTDRQRDEQETMLAQQEELDIRNVVQDEDHDD